MIEDLAKALKTKREELKMDTGQLAILLGTNQHNIYKWEGKTQPTNVEIYRKIENFIEGRYDNVVREGVVDLRILMEIQEQEKEINVKKSKEKNPPITMNLDITSSTINAQSRMIEVLETENKRLRAEIADLRQKYNK